MNLIEKAKHLVQEYQTNGVHREELKACADEMQAAILVDAPTISSDDSAEFLKYLDLVFRASAGSIEGYHLYKENDRLRLHYFPEEKDGKQVMMCHGEYF